VGFVSGGYAQRPKETNKRREGMNMTIGEGIAFAALMWAVVQISYLLHQRSKAVTIDEVRDTFDKLNKRLDNLFE
jgi:hypothetical protein